jgi:hypothetical protein
MLELACPDSCQYLRSARASAGEREHELLAKDPATARRLSASVSKRDLMLLYAIDDAIVGAHRGVEGPALRGLENEEIAAAAENAIKNLETEESGLIYEHRAGLPRVQELGRRIRARLDEANERAPADQRFRRDEMIKALSFVRDVAESHTRREGGETKSYIRYISLFIPWPEEVTKPLII